MSRLSQVGLSKRAIVFIIICLVLLGLIVVLGILPNKMEKAGLESEAAILEARLEEQRILYPLYAGIRDRLDHKSEMETILDKMDQDFGPVHIDNASEMLSFMAGQVGMDKYSFSPVPESLTRNSDQLLLEGQLSGEYEIFRAFLLKLTAWENFSRLELLEVQSREQVPGYNILVWMTIS